MRNSKKSLLLAIKDRSGNDIKAKIRGLLE